MNGISKFDLNILLSIEFFNQGGLFCILLSRTKRLIDQIYCMLRGKKGRGVKSNLYSVCLYLDMLLCDSQIGDA
jgi:hypothetical protein